MNEAQMMQILGFTDADKARWIETNARYYGDVEQGWMDKLNMHIFPKRSASVYVMPSYQSPISGKWIDTPSQRRDDLRRNGCRPWEGMADEKANAAQQRQYAAAESDKALDHAVHTAWQQLPDSKKQTLMQGA